MCKDKRCKILLVIMHKIREIFTELTCKVYFTNLQSHRNLDHPLFLHGNLDKQEQYVNIHHVSIPAHIQF